MMCIAVSGVRHVPVVAGMLVVKAILRVEEQGMVTAWHIPMTRHSSSNEH